MYESEANNARESSTQIPESVLAKIAELKSKISARTVLPWSEHCTECVWPTCYSSCELYSPREDGRCRRFVDGMVRIDCPEAANSYLLKIRFKRWGKLWTPGSIRLHTLQDASKIERRDQQIGSFLYQLPSPLKKVAVTKRYSFKKRIASNSHVNNELPDAFIIECHNPEKRSVRLSLSMRAVGEKSKIPFQELISLVPGFQRIQISCAKISELLDLKAPFSIELMPDGEFEQLTLYFGLIDFVKESPVSHHPDKGSPKKIKCVIWDLDNTLWDGILIEDGAQKIRLKPGIVEVIKDLDERGILHSIASKNNRDEAISALKNFGLESYFLCPQISWQPKSGAIEAIAQQLNIGKDTLLFIDDSAFEREQVKNLHPDVQVLDAALYTKLPVLDECHVPVTSESRSRRLMYQVEKHRQNTAANFGDDYAAFLRYCDIHLNIRSLSVDSLDRVHELTTRTNQMNFSGNKYDREVLTQILASPYLDTFVLDVEDRFGSYGTVGFAIVDNRTPVMTDLMFSCRIQSKRVEHAFLGYLMRKYILQTGKDFWVFYRKTPRNAPSGQVFSDMSLEEQGIEEGVTRLRFPKEREVPEEDIIKITAFNQEPITSS